MRRADSYINREKLGVILHNEALQTTYKSTLIGSERSYLDISFMVEDKGCFNAENLESHIFSSVTHAEQGTLSIEDLMIRNGWGKVTVSFRESELLARAKLTTVQNMAVEK